MYEIAQERYSERLWRELMPLAQRNWEASPSFETEIPVDPDEQRYAVADQVGRCVCMVARSEGVIAGYAVFFVGTSTHHRTMLCGYGDSIYVEPEHQGSGLASRLLAKCEDRLREMGVKRIGWTVDVGSAIHELLNAAGYGDDEIVVEKVL
jgi:GNAT superfamily N-acetyltransferase